MSTCELFDRYRDNELNVAERAEFKSHLALCDECRAKKALLDNVVYVLRNETVRPLNLADQIARKAFQPKNSWASDVISWIRPVPAMVTLATVAVLFSSLWIISGNRQVSFYSEYELLIEEADAGHVSTLSQKALSQARSDNAVELWLEGESQ